VPSRTIPVLPNTREDLYPCALYQTPLTVLRPSSQLRGKDFILPLRILPARIYGT
jgi:hypothetical protein